jgi:hypothetical protein
MPGGKRTDRISERDLEVLEFIARFGVAPRRAVAIWADTARTVTIVREGRLRDAGLIRPLRSIGDSGPLVACTRAGLRACGRSDLRVPRLSLAAVRHESIVALHAAELELAGERLLSEREILAHERAVGRRTLSAALPGGRFHRADLVRLAEDGAPAEAIEVELTLKGANRLDDLLRAWRRAVAQRQVAQVVYRCPARTLPFVERAVERTRTASAIRVEELWPGTTVPPVGRSTTLTRLADGEGIPSTSTPASGT